MNWSLTSCSGPSLCVAGVVPHLVGVVASCGHSHSGETVGTSAVATSWALPQRVHLGLALPLLRLLDLHLPKLSQSTALCWSSSSSLPCWSRPLTAKRAGEDQEGAPCLAHVAR